MNFSGVLPPICACTVGARMAAAKHNAADVHPFLTVRAFRRSMISDPATNYLLLLENRRLHLHQRIYEAILDFKRVGHTVITITTNERRLGLYLRM